MTEAQYIKNLTPPSGRVDVILDTDTFNEIDDQFALVYLLKNKEKLNTVGLCAAPFHNGRSSSPADGMLKSFNEIIKLLDLMGESELKSIVYKGSEEYLKDEQTPSPSPAADFMAAEAEKYSSENPLYIVAIGAITNVASAFLKNPSMSEKTVVVWLGGKAHHFNDCEEFNMSQDIAAARVIMKSGVPFVQLPCAGVVDKFITGRYELEHFYYGTNKVAVYLAENTISYCDRHGRDVPWSKVIWDVTAVAWLLNGNGKYMNYDIVPMRLPSYDNKYGEPEKELRMAYVYNIRRDPLFTDMTDLLVK